MLQKEDPFEEFKRHKSVERLESDFKGKGEEKKKTLKKLFKDFSEGGDVDEKVEEEMKDFLDVSKELASTVISHIEEKEGETKENREPQIEDIFKETEDREEERTDTLRKGEESSRQQAREDPDLLLDKHPQNLQNSKPQKDDEVGEFLPGGGENAPKEESQFKRTNDLPPDRDAGASPDQEESKPKHAIKYRFREKREKASLLDRLIFTSNKIDALLEVLLEKKIITEEELGDKIDDL